MLWVFFSRFSGHLPCEPVWTFSSDLYKGGGDGGQGQGSAGMEAWGWASGQCVAVKGADREAWGILLMEVWATALCAVDPFPSLAQKEPVRVLHHSIVLGAVGSGVSSPLGVCIGHFRTLKSCHPWLLAWLLLNWHQSELLSLIYHHLENLPVLIYSKKFKKQSREFIHTLLKIISFMHGFKRHVLLWLSRVLVKKLLSLSLFTCVDCSSC